MEGCEDVHDKKFLQNKIMGKKVGKSQALWAIDNFKKNLINLLILWKDTIRGVRGGELSSVGLELMDYYGLTDFTD